MTLLLDITGQCFGSLTVLQRLPGHSPVQWLCRCDCGEERAINSQSLRTGHTKSCGCQARLAAGQRMKTHGKSGTAEYRIYRGIVNRCTRPNTTAFPIYGGAGIQICGRWLASFEKFLEDMGSRPSPRHSIDRFPDPFGNYEPTNCRWATPQQQVNNRRNTRYVTYRGVEMALTDATRLAGSVIHYEAAWVRIRTGWPVEKALETPRLFESHNSRGHANPLSRKPLDERAGMIAALSASQIPAPIRSAALAPSDDPARKLDRALAPQPDALGPLPSSPSVDQQPSEQRPGPQPSPCPQAGAHLLSSE